MSVSSIASGTFAAQDGGRSAVAPRIDTKQAEHVQQAQGNIKAEARTESKADSITDVQARTNLAAPTPHANRVGVAAYAAIMNPAPPVSMRTEA